jgi:hypothetical protein
MESTSTPCRRRTLDKTITASPAEHSIAQFVARHRKAEVQRLQNGGFSVRVPDGLGEPVVDIVCEAIAKPCGINARAI